jgi:hypothetical protein
MAATSATLALLAAVATAMPGTARAGDWMPLLPDQDFYDFQLFAPPDLQSYEIYPEASEGIFFSYDRLWWGITIPQTTDVARTQAGNYIFPQYPISPQAVVDLNNQSVLAGQQYQNANPNLANPYPNGVTGGVYVYGADPLFVDLNTSWMRTKMTTGDRYEGGWIYDNRGVLLSYFGTGEQVQQFSSLNEFAAASPTQTFTQSQTGGGATQGGVGNVNQAQTASTITSVSPPPDHIISQKLTQTNTTQIQSAGVAMLLRRELGRRGSGTTVRFSLGPRFIQFEDRYNIGYEANQYAFNRTTGTTGTTGGTGGTGTTGGTGGTGTTGGTGGTGTTGGTGAGTGATSTGVVTTSAGDFFGISGADAITGQGAGTPLQAGAWETYTSNNMVGPEIGLLLEADRGRWSFSSALKFTAGLNWQNNIYRGSNFPNSLGADYLRTTFTIPSVNVSDGSATGTGQTQLIPPPLFLQLYGTGQSNTTNAAEHRFVFSPVGEWRFGSEFRVSQAITLRAGYTGMWMAGLARASSNTGYVSSPERVKYARQSNGQDVDPATGQTVPDGQWYVAEREGTYNRVGAVPGSTEYVFTNGVDLGIEIKY